MHIATNKYLRVIAKPLLVFTRWFGRHYPEQLVRIRYLARFKKKLNLDTPKTLNEKILWCELRGDTSLWTKLADKYAVRDYLIQKGYAENLVKLYGVWDKASDIDFDSLPNSFVLKTTHGSGDIIVIKDKTKIDAQSVRKTMDKNIKQVYGELEGGLHYMRIKSRAIAEELLINDEFSSRYSSSLIDYKIWCFNGKAHYVWVCADRNSGTAKVMTYDRDWNAHPEYCAITQDFSLAAPMPCPKNYKEMLKMAEDLAAPFPVVRVDLYNLNGKIYFGEMTFTSLGGMMDFYSDEFQNMCGEIIQLPK